MKLLLAPLPMIIEFIPTVPKLVFIMVVFIMLVLMLELSCLESTL